MPDPHPHLTILNVAYPLARVGPDAVGGAEQIVGYLDDALVRAGHRSLVIAPADSAVRGTLIPIQPPAGPLDEAARAAAQAKTRAAIRWVLNDYSVDLIHLHGVDFDTYLPPPGPPVLATLHLPPHTYSPDVFAIDRPATFLQCVSQTQQMSLPSASAPVLPPIPNGVPLPPAISRHAEANFVLALGRVCPEKGFHLAARAARIAGRELLLGGHVFAYPTHAVYFREVLAPLLDERWFRFLGPLGPADKQRLLCQARCLVIPSQIPETSSLVAMESLASGTPVVAFRAGALTEIVDDGRTGFLVDSVEEMASAIERVDEIDPVECRQAAEQKFSVEVMVDRYLARYTDLIRRVRSTPLHLNVAEVTAVDGLDAIRDEWAELWRRAGTSIFQHPDWLIPWCRPFGVREPWVLLFRRADRLVGVAPLLVYERHRERVLTLMGGGISDDQDLLLEAAERKPVMRALWTHLAQHADRWDTLEVENVPASSPLLEPEPRAWQGAAPEMHAVRPALDLGPTVRRLEDLDASDLLKECRYQTRHAQREGLPVTVEDATATTFDRLFTALADLHRARWSDRGQSGMLESDLEAFHREVGRRLLDEGLLRLHVVSLGDRPAAAFYGYHACGQTIFYLGGFDPLLARFSPGTLAIAHAVEYAITHDHAHTFDFLRGSEAYKYRWGAVDRPLFRRQLRLTSDATTPIVSHHAA